MLCTPVDSSTYSSLTGKLIQFIKTRHEIRQFVSYLCSFNSNPCEVHYRQAIHILRYLFSSPGMGCVFHASGEGVIISGSSDSACGIFPDGRSSNAYFLSIGLHNAPFVCSAKAQTPVATCPMTGEYYAAGSACSDIIFFRQLADDLGWLQSEATVLCMDNKTAMALAIAPEVSRKSRHILLKYHNIRDLISECILSVVYVNTKDMRANVLTKVLIKKQFIFERDRLLNRG